MSLTRENISKIAFEMFRDWTRNAKKEFPHLDFSIIDETNFVEDLLHATGKASIAIKNHEKAERRKQMGFDKGYICGFIGGNINVKWYNDYVIKQSKEYKEFLVLKSIKIHLELFELERVKINSIYAHLLFRDLNIYQNTSIEHEKLKHFSLEELDIVPKDDILIVLNNKINNYINNYLNFKSAEFLDSVEKYFTDDDILAIASHNIEKGV